MIFRAASSCVGAGRRSAGRSEIVPLRRLADKVCRIINAPGTFVSCYLRIWADRTCAIHHSIDTMRSKELTGRLSFLEPLRERADGVKSVGTFSTAAMSHPWQHVQADGILGRPAHRLQNTLVPLVEAEKSTTLPPGKMS